MKGSMILVRDDKIVNLYMIPNASSIKDSSSLNNGDQFHGYWAHKNIKRVIFNLGGEEVKKLEHEDVMTSGLALKPSSGNSSSYFSASSEKLGSSQAVGAVRRRMKF